MDALTNTVHSPLWMTGKSESHTVALVELQRSALAYSVPLRRSGVGERDAQRESRLGYQTYQVTQSLSVGSLTYPSPQTRVDWHVLLTTW